MRNHIILTIILFSILLAPSIPVYTSQQPFFLSDLSEENIHWQLNNLTSFLTRRAGTVECNMSAEYIYNYISSVNVSASYEYFNTPSGGLINVEAEIKGSSQPYKYIVLGAHYDSISNGESAPGAVDNAASVAIMMELCRLIPKYNLAKSVKLLFFSAEEIGRYGSLNWVNRNYEIRENISAVLILDMVAYGNSLVLDYNSVSKPLADYILEKTSFKNYLTVEANNYLSDHQSFWSANMPAVLIHQNDPLEYPYYHTPEDTVDKVDFNMLMLTASITLEAAYYLATDLNFENLYYGVNLIYPIIILSLPIAFLTCLGVIIKFKNRRSSSENSS